MKKSVAMKWIKALESGKYRQAKSRLKAPNGMCCLGVLCEISGVSSFDEHGRYCGEHQLLAKEVQAWAGMVTEVGELPNSSRRKHPTLVNLNDLGGYSFKRLAAVIRKHWKDL